MTVTIRAVTEGDYDRWLPLWRGYQDFFDDSLPDKVTRNTFDEIVRVDGGMEGLVAVDERDALVGMVNYILHPTTFSLGPRCYLEDLFVDKSARSDGVGRKLIEAVTEAAREAGADRIYWHTNETNYPGRALYDKMAKVSHIKYEKKL